MFKKLFLVVLMVSMVSPLIFADSLTGVLVFIHDSRYIVDGVDFAAKDDVAVSALGLSLSWNKIGTYWYAAVSPDYFEWGVDLNGTLSFKGVDFKSTFFPFGWTVHGETHWGFMVSEDITINTKPLPVLGRYAYAYTPDFKDLNGHYFYLGTKGDAFGFDWQAGLNYNKGLFVGDNQGMGAILSISKSVELSEKVFLDAYFKYYINHPDVNEDEQVVGTTISVKL